MNTNDKTDALLALAGDLREYAEGCSASYLKQMAGRIEDLAALPAGDAHYVAEGRGYWQIVVEGKPYNFRNPPGFKLVPDTTPSAANVDVSDAMVERACKRYAFREDGAVFPDAYSDEEVAAERALMRGFLTHVLIDSAGAMGDGVNILGNVAGHDDWLARFRVEGVTFYSPLDDKDKALRILSANKRQPTPPAASVDVEALRAVLSEMDEVMAPHYGSSDARQAIYGWRTRIRALIDSAGGVQE